MLKAVLTQRIHRKSAAGRCAIRNGVIGVGFTYVNGKQILDFDVDEIVALGKAKFVSNRINCTGKATINSLIDNVIELYKMNFDIK